LRLFFFPSKHDDFSGFFNKKIIIIYYLLFYLFLCHVTRVQNFAIQKNIDSKEAEISDAIFLVLDAYAPATPRGILLFYENYVNFHPYTR